MKKHTIAIFVGGSNSFNIRQTIQNYGQMLGDVFDLDLHLITTQPSAYGPEIKSRFELFGAENSSSLRGGMLALREYFQSNEPEIITQIGRVPIYGNMISVAKSKNTSFICRFSGDSFYEYKLRNGWQKIPTYIVRNIIGRIPLQTGTSFIVMGPTGKRRLIKRGVPPEKVKILPPPIDAARFNTQVETDLMEIPSNRSIALFVGRRTRMKGIDVLERTIPEIIDRRSDIQFVLVGGDDGSPNISKKYKEYITIVGEVKPELMPSVYEQADLLIHPSLIEGLSRAVLEAILSEIPVVVRNVGDLDYATSNTFDTEDEFIDMVCNFEDLPTEDASKFTVSKLQIEYINYFKSVI